MFFLSFLLLIFPFLPFNLIFFPRLFIPRCQPYFLCLFFVLTVLMYHSISYNGRIVNKEVVGTSVMIINAKLHIFTRHQTVNCVLP